MHAPAFNRAIKQIVMGETNVLLERNSKFEPFWLSDAEMKTFTHALQHSNVDRLTLSGEKIDDDKIRILADALPHTRITMLNIKDTGLTTGGALKLLNPLSSSDVEFVHLPRRVSHEMKEKIHQVLADKSYAKIVADSKLAYTTSPTTTVTETEIIERQRRAALEDGQGI